MALSVQEHSSACSPQADKDRLLISWLALLCVLSALAAFQALFLPRWPRSRPLSVSHWSAVLRQSGLQPRLLPSIPASRSAERALSPGLVWRLDGGRQLILVQATAARRFNFQTAFLTRAIAAVHLSQRRRDVPIVGTDAGLLQGRSALQTCLVPQAATPPIAAATASALTQAVDLQTISPLDSVKALVGLRPTRDFSCLLVTLRSDSTDPIPAGLWQRLLLALKTAVQVAPRQ